VNDVWTEVRFWAQVIDDSKRTVICSAELESRVKGWVEARGMGGIITVQADRLMPDDQIYIIDTPAIEASARESFQHSMWDWQRSFEARRDDHRLKFWRGITEA
jgi:hypothetical protein